MSYDKCTQRSDVIDHVARLCKAIGLPFELTVLAEVYDHGNSWGGPTPLIPIRRLEVRGVVFRERMERTDDCDADDTVECYQFGPGDEPPDFGVAIDENGKATR